MSQSDLYREVARATGETVNRIKQMGFSLLVVLGKGLLPLEIPAESARSQHHAIQ